MLLVLVIASLIISSLISIPYVVDGYWLPKQCAWIIGSIIIGIYGLMWVKPIREHRNICLIFFSIYTIGLFSQSFLWFHVNTPITADGIAGIAQKLNWNVSPIIPFLSILGSTLAIQVFATRLDQNHWRVIAKSIGYLSVVVALCGWCQFFGWDFVNPVGYGINKPEAHSPGTFFGSPIASASFLSISAPFLLGRGVLNKAMFACVAGLLLIMKGGSLGAMASLYAASMAYCFLTGHKKQAFWMIAAGILSVPFLFKSLIDFGGRWKAWHEITSCWISTSPLTGIGLGSIRTMFLKAGWHWYPLHNDLIQLFIETGLIGGCLFLLSLSKPLIHSLRNMSPIKASWVASGVSYVLNSQSAFPSHSGCLAVGCLIFAAIEAA